MERAEREPDDPDAAFIFYWIAFNAAYAQDRPRSLDSTEREHFADFFDTILSLDSGHMIYDAIWERFSDSSGCSSRTGSYPSRSGTTTPAGAMRTGSIRSRVARGGFARPWPLEKPVSS